MAESAEELIYVLDASSWISIDGNPDANRILSCLDRLIERGAIKCPPQCLNEVRNEYMAGWIKTRRTQISHTLRTKVEFLKLLGEVTFKLAGMSGARGKRNRADPYLVAYAAHRNRTENPTTCIVVCEESAVKRANRKLPTACKAFDVEPIALLKRIKPFDPDNADLLTSKACGGAHILGATNWYGGDLSNGKIAEILRSSRRILN
jgi:Domain of unknown function (DUF4411)